MITDRMWARLLSSTNQPSFMKDKDVTENTGERTEHQNPNGGIHTETTVSVTKQGE